MTLTAPATRKLRGFKAGFTIQPSTPPAPAAAVIGTIVVLDNYILTVPVSSVPADADYAELLWSDTEGGTYIVYQTSIPALVTTNVSVNTVTAVTKWFKVKTINAYGNTLSAATSATSSAGSSSTPAQMVNLRVTAKTTTSLTYTWDALANVTSYTLQRWNGSDWTTAQVTGITGTTTTVSTLTANTEYGARGRGVNTNAASPNGPLSAETWDFTGAITTPVPTPPVVTWQRISGTVIRFLFAGGSDATSWAGFSRSPSGSGSYSSPITLTVDVAYYDLTVSLNETADFYVTATNAQGSDNSNIATGDASASYTVAFSSALDSFTGWTSVGGAWSIQSDGGGSFARCAYNGANTGPYQLRKNMPTQGLREYWIAFDTRQSVTTVTSKLMKFFGIRTNGGTTYSNNTWNAGYGGGFTGVMYGNAASGGNDANCVMKYNNLNTDTRSTENVVFRMLQDLVPSTSWRRFKFHWKQNSNSTTPDGEVQVYIDDVLWMDIRNLYNRGDDSEGYEYFTVGDYTQTNTPFNFDVKNLVLSFDGMPT